MFADDVLQPMYDLAYFLYPDPAAALTVTLDAADRLALLQRLREHPTGHAWRRLPEAWLPQYCVYLASDGRERAHERPRPGRANGRGRPGMITWCAISSAWSGGPWTGRPVMWLWRSAASSTAIRWEASYGWPPVLCESYQIQRIRVRLTQQLQARFPRAHLFEDDHGMRRTRVPTASDQRLVQHALAMFTPWGEAHVSPPPLDQLLLDTHFGQASARSNWDRTHALINPVDAGLLRLIREFNTPFPPGSAQRLAEPDTMLAIPRFDP